MLGRTVRAFAQAEWKCKCVVVGADARAVRPYMLCNNQLVHLFTANLSTKIKSDARAVRPYLHSLAHQSQPFHNRIWPILPCNMGEIAPQNG